MADEISEQKAELITKSKKVKLEEVRVVSPQATAASPNKTQIIARGKGGMFAKKNNVVIDPKTITAQFREAMVSVNDETGLSDLQEFYLALASIVKRASTDEDPKAGMAAVKAYEALMSRVWGKPDVSDAELEARATSGVKVILLNQQPVGKTLDDSSERKKIPSFAEVTNIETNVPESERQLLSDGKHSEEGNKAR